jgi:acetate kinase
MDEIEGVGHRVAHGGNTPESQIIDDKVIKLIDDLSIFAPLHNPVNLTGILAFKEILPDIPQVAVYDTAFHQTIEPEYYLYPLPYKYFEEHKIRKYGFHGTSHKYIADTLKESNPEIKKVVNCHLGNGASICAIDDGKSVNTSMGFTPLAGLMMGTRTGDIDPAIVTYLMELENATPEQIDDIMYNESGFLGVSGISNDARDVEEAADNNHERAQLAMKMFANRVAQTIATYAVDLDGLDAVIFTAGIGENSNTVRKMVCDQLSVLGINIDMEKNSQNAEWIHSDRSKVKIGIIPTNEELVIARDVVALTNE